MSHLAIFEYQWEQKSFLDRPRSGKECFGVQLGTEEIRYVWTHQGERNHPEPSSSPREAPAAGALALRHAGPGMSRTTGPVTSGDR